MEEMEAEKFCLRWNEFETNISSAFKELRESKDFFDVTLVCEQHQLEAHKVILSACSPFFRDILRRNPHKHPLLYLKGVKFVDMQGLLSFMYQGEVNISQVRLNSFLSIAEDLKVKGLTQNGTPPSNGSPVHYSPPSPSTKKKRPMSSQFSQRPSKVANVEYSEADSQVPQQSHEINIKHKETAPESKEIATQSQIVATPALQDIKEEQLSEVDLDQPYQMVEYPMEGYEGQDEVESDEYVPGYSLQHMDPDLQQSAPTGGSVAAATYSNHLDDEEEEGEIRLENFYVSLPGSGQKAEIN